MYCVKTACLRIKTKTNPLTICHSRTNIMQSRRLHTAILRLVKEVPKNLKGKTKSSQEWISRQLSDPYVERSKLLNYRCRSAFKLMEIDDKHKILRPGMVVIDCGGAPGSWSQVAVHRTNSHGRQENIPKGVVVGIDLLPIYAIEGAHTISNMDFTTKAAQDRIKTFLQNRKIDCVLSDMAPNATGVRSLDQENITNLCYSVLRFALQMSSQNANLLIKVWDNGDVPQLERDMLKYYKSVKSIKPNASRSESSEKFLLAKNFLGLERT